MRLASTEGPRLNASSPNEAADRDGLPVIPEAATLLLLGTGLAGIAGLARRMRHVAK